MIHIDLFETVKVTGETTLLTEISQQTYSAELCCAS